MKTEKFLEISLGIFRIKKCKLCFKKRTLQVTEVTPVKFQTGFSYL